jgi:hypothetical protein
LNLKLFYEQKLLVLNEKVADRQKVRNLDYLKPQIISIEKIIHFISIDLWIQNGSPKD